MTRSEDWPLWLWLVVDLLAVARLTRLVVQDTITAPARRWIADRFEGLLVELVFCVWCTSIWAAAGAVALTFTVGWLWGYPALLLALSQVAGWLLADARFHVAAAGRWIGSHAGRLARTVRPARGR